MFEIIITDKAKQDIKKTLAYIKEKLFNPKAATELADMLESEISSLSLFPLSGTPVPDQFLSDFDLRPNLMDYYKRHIGVAREFLTRVISEAKAYGCG